MDRRLRPGGCGCGIRTRQLGGEMQDRLASYRNSALARRCAAQPARLAGVAACHAIADGAGAARTCPFIIAAGSRPPSRGRSRAWKSLSLRLVGRSAGCRGSCGSCGTRVRKSIRCRNSGQYGYRNVPIDISCRPAAAAPIDSPLQARPAARLCPADSAPAGRRPIPGGVGRVRPGSAISVAVV